MDLKTPIRQLDRVYKMYANRLERLGITTLEDLLYHIPFRYEDYTIVSEIGAVQPGEIVTIRGKVLTIRNIYTSRFKTLQKAVVSDDTGSLEVTWFNQPFLLKNMHQNDTVSVSGKIAIFGRKLGIVPSQYEVVTEESTLHTGRLVPIYPETKGLSSKWLRNRIAKLLPQVSETISEYLPPHILTENNFPNIAKAIMDVHFPKKQSDGDIARERLAFDELLLLQLASAKRKMDWQKKLIGNPFHIAKFKKEIASFWKQLPFTLTGAQRRAVQDIFHDLGSKKPMNRLLEGDVGSGKTVVATIAMYLSYLNGFQSVLMAPTEILAHQHYNTILNLLSPLGLSVALVTGDKKLKNKNAKMHILIGTHAVLAKHIKFDNLGLVVIDEQQRFGVEQRGIIRDKGKNPHLLTMTATPIPRTVALTMYGELDLSLLDQMPIGRKRVKTWLVPQEKRDRAYQWIEKQLVSEKSQAFIICPFIEESESLTTVKAASKEFARLKKDIFPKRRLGLLHGRLKAKEKKETLEAFKNHTLDVLVATPVVEVGIDIPNATIILIEGSERFGLSQLHQLRGRVGRGEKQSYCLLFTESGNEQTLKRLKAMEQMYVGSELSELDLRLRGPGDMYGIMQHGIPNLKVASFSNFPLIEKTKKEARLLFPRLSDYKPLEEKVKKMTMEHVTPD